MNNGTKFKWVSQIKPSVIPSSKVGATSFSVAFSKSLSQWFFCQVTICSSLVFHFFLTVSFDVVDIPFSIFFALFSSHFFMFVPWTLHIENVFSFCFHWFCCVHCVLFVIFLLWSWSWCCWHASKWTMHHFTVARSTKDNKFLSICHRFCNVLMSDHLCSWWIGFSVGGLTPPGQLMCVKTRMKCGCAHLRALAQSSRFTGKAEHLSAPELQNNPRWNKATNEGQNAQTSEILQALPADQCTGNWIRNDKTHKARGAWFKNIQLITETVRWMSHHENVKCWITTGMPFVLNVLLSAHMVHQTHSSLKLSCLSSPLWDWIGWIGLDPCHAMNVTNNMFAELRHNNSKCMTHAKLPVPLVLKGFHFKLDELILVNDLIWLQAQSPNLMQANRQTSISGILFRFDHCFR